MQQDKLTLTFCASGLHKKQSPLLEKIHRSFEQHATRGEAFAQDTKAFAKAPSVSLTDA
jgi:hypothetical protein